MFFKHETMLNYEESGRKKQIFLDELDKEQIIVSSALFKKDILRSIKS